MSTFAPKSSPTFNAIKVLYKSLFVDKISHVQIPNVIESMAVGKVNKEAITAMRNSSVRPVSVFGSKPQFDGSGGFLETTIVKRNKAPEPTEAKSIFATLPSVYSYANEAPAAPLAESTEVLASKRLIKRLAPIRPKVDPVPSNILTGLVPPKDPLAQGKHQRGASSAYPDTPAPTRPRPSPQQDPVSDPQGRALRGPFARRLTTPAPTSDPVVAPEDDLDLPGPRIMCLDVGTRIIGVALSSVDFHRALPLMSLPATVEVDDLDELKRLIKKPREMERVSHDLEGKIYRLMQPAEMAHALNALRRRYNVIATVVGMPDELVGRKNTQQRLIAQFVQEQQQHHGLGRGEQVVMWNERKSTMKALAVLREQGVRVDEAIDPRKVAADIKAGRKPDTVYARAKGAKVDSIAASIILDDFLKSLHQDGPTALMAPTQR